MAIYWCYLKQFPANIILLPNLGQFAFQSNTLFSVHFCQIFGLFQFFLDYLLKYT